MSDRETWLRLMAAFGVAFWSGVVWTSVHVEFFLFWTVLGAVAAVAFGWLLRGVRL